MLHDILDGQKGRCKSCGVEWDFTTVIVITEPYKEEKMGKLADRAREKSPFITLDIGEETPVLVFKSWKEATDHFGNETFRYFFDLITDSGIITKQLDNRSQSFAIAMDKIAFGDKVIIKREPKKDDSGDPIENKSIWTVKKAE
jgi:hypothetical protein